jgi:glycine/D-amino acid oxidase-like deaminating enzyme
MARRRLTILQAALGGLILAGGINGWGWTSIVLGGGMILLALANGGAAPKPEPPAKKGPSAYSDISASN